ncbi:MAG: NADH-quinone oxidoreductase subunit D [Planctomycetes bacterium]|nr:NADH-quinone oxidoreductase subunit D [Planctomycetota bacterium]
MAVETKLLEFKETSPSAHGELMTLNYGPQHPATHGVLRLLVTLDGEMIIDLDPVVGYLHRGKEKEAEHLGYHRWFPFTDRLDYLGPIQNNIGYSLAVEKLAGIETPPRAQAIRVLLAEVSRLTAHLIYLGTTAIDLGAVTMFFLCFKDRERLFDLLDQYCGHRTNPTPVRFGGLLYDMTPELTAAFRSFANDFVKSVDEFEGMLTANRIWHDRNRGVAVLTKENAIALSLTGPNLRGSGIAHDLRKARPYDGYEQYQFDIPTGTLGDAYDRYLVRVQEMRESAKIILQACDKLDRDLKGGEIVANDRRYVLPARGRVLDSMEELIYQFKVVTDMRLPEGEVYAAIEAAKGELGFYIVSKGERTAHRCGIRSPSFINLQALRPLARGRLLSDLVAIIGSLDFVMGECDR